MLVVMTGLPGTGKSAVAEAVGRALGAPVFSVDPLEATLLRRGVTREQLSDRIAYDLLAMLAEAQLNLGQSAVLDAVNQFAWLRRQWRDLAARLGAAARLIECVCSDPALHRKLIESRQRDITGFTYEPTWEQVVARAAGYEPCTEDRLVLDATQPLEENRERARQFVLAAG